MRYFMSDTVAFNTAYKQALAAYTKAANNEEDNNNSSNGGSGFSGFISDALKGLNKTLNVAESNSSKTLVGEADIADVVTSVGEAELSLQTVIAVRDRAISAYQDIIKMPI